MNSNTLNNVVGGADLQICGDAAGRNGLKGRCTRILLIAAVTLGSTISLAGCNSDENRYKTSSNNNFSVTRDQIVRAFSACLLPGNQSAFTTGSAGQAGECRIR